MDIRNFFDKKKKAPPPAPRAAASRREKLHASSGALSAPSLRQTERAGGVYDVRDGGKYEPAVDDGDSDTELEDNGVTVVSKASRNGGKKAAGAHRVGNIGSTDDDPPKEWQPPSRPAAKEKVPLESSDEEAGPPPPPRRRSPPRRCPEQRKRKGSQSGEGETARRRIVDDSGAEDGSDFEKGAGTGARARAVADNRDDGEEKYDVDSMKDENSDDDDGFKPKAASDSEDEDESPEESVVQQSRKRRAVASPTRSSPRMKPSPRLKLLTRKSAVTVEKEPTPIVATGPPKYHPPSSKLMTRIPYLVDNPRVSILSAPPLPQLPGNNPNFSLENLNPQCLEGLTFVFSGILSTDDELTKRTSASVSMSSPTKGDYYSNRNFDCAEEGGHCELSRDAASDIVKSLGGRVTGSVSGKTDYLVGGSILEDGREVEEGSKYRKVLEIWDNWREKWHDEYNAADVSGGDGERGNKRKRGKANGRTKAQKKDRDPNTLVEIVQGIYEFYGLVTYLSEWKRATLSEGERLELDARLKPVVAEGVLSVKEVVKAEPLATATGSTPLMSRENSLSASAPSTASKTPGNPYAKKTTPLSNPHAKVSVSNPYTKLAVSNPYAKSTISNPYARKLSPSNSYTSVSTAPAALTSQPTKSNYPHPRKELGANSLWADRYAPSNSGEILGNADSVNKLKRWLSSWEQTFNNPKRQVKGFGGSNGPWKAALLSGPPGIGKTTTATLVVRESSRDVLELNASDVRSKKSLSQALGDVTGSRVLNFVNVDAARSKKNRGHAATRRCIIMDEVDGMGAGDRSGTSELIQMIKKSKVPIICICNDRTSQKMKSLVQYCMDLRYRRPTKKVIARRAVEIGRLEGMEVEINAAEAVAESCGNDIRQVLNCLQMWSCKKRTRRGDASASMTYRDLKDRQSSINKDEVLRVSMFDACRLIVEGSRGLSGANPKAVTASLMKRTDAYFVDYMLMGLMVHQNYLKVATGQYNGAKLRNNEDAELEALNRVHDAAFAISDLGICEENLRGGDQNWSLLPLCSVLAVKVGNHAGGDSGGVLPGYPEFAGWLGKNSTRNKKFRLLQELKRHVNYKVSAEASELRMNYLPFMRQQFQQLLFDKDGALVSEAIELMDEYGLDRDDVFENLDEFLLDVKDPGIKKLGDLDGKSKAAFTRAYNAVAHRAQALVAEQGAEKTGRQKGGGGSLAAKVELDVVDDDAAVEGNLDDDINEEEDLEVLKKKFLKKGRGGKGKAVAVGKAKVAPTKAINGKKGKKK